MACLTSLSSASQKTAASGLAVVGWESVIGNTAVAPAGVSGGFRAISLFNGTHQQVDQLFKRHPVFSEQRLFLLPNSSGLFGLPCRCGVDPKSTQAGGFLLPLLFPRGGSPQNHARRSVLLGLEPLKAHKHCVGLCVRFWSWYPFRA